MKLFIEDCGREGVKTIAVTEGNSNDTKFYDYTERDYNERSGKLLMSFWKRIGYVGELVIDDAELDSEYVVNVK
jgi:hypothetical protein